MAFAVNHNEAYQGYEMVEQGKYEGIIVNPKFDTTKGGTEYINVPVVIRNDVNQKFQNCYVWIKLWKRKEPSAADIACGGYSNSQIQTLSKAVRLPDGQAYNTIEQWMAALNNRPILIDVKHEEYNGNTNAVVKYMSETKVPQVNHKFGERQQSTPGAAPIAGFTQVEDEDLPWN